ncbi:MAG: arylsulfatase [Kiritimatiellales bacterium]
MKQLSFIIPAVFSATAFSDEAMSKNFAERPNIIFILADDLGYGDLSCYGQQRFSTPNIDRLAKEGMRFTQHYSGSPVCAPSRCTLMTGLHTGHAPIRGNLNFVMPPFFLEGQIPMPRETFTVVKLLKCVGYTTGIFGKWGLGAPDSGSEPLDMGFDRFYGYNCQVMAHSYYPYFLWNDRMREMLWNNFGTQCIDYAPDFIHRNMLDFVRENKTRPFFCYYAPVQPHADMIAPEKYMEKYRGKFPPEKSYKTEGTPENFRRGPYVSQSEGHAAFAAMMNMLDDYVGELLNELEILELRENTLIFFSSDNGPHEEGGHDPEYFNSNGSLRGIKRDLYEGGIRVPLIASWPGKISAGAVSDYVSAFWDFLATAAELTGQKIPSQTDGISMLPVLFGGEPAPREFLYWEIRGGGGKMAIRKGDWKGVRYNVIENPGSPLELYNIAIDPRETSNVAAQYPEIANDLDRLMKNARTESEDPRFNYR